jgi:hypothetical protein
VRDVVALGVVFVTRGPHSLVSPPALPSEFSKALGALNSRKYLLRDLYERVTQRSDDAERRCTKATFLMNAAACAVRHIRFIRPTAGPMGTA